MIIALRLFGLAFGLSSALLSQAATIQNLQKRIGGWWTPDAQFDPADGGWLAIPQMYGATIDRQFNLGHGVNLVNYVTDNFTASEVERVVIVFPGKPRDSWNYWNSVRNALDHLVNDTTRNPPVDKNKFLIASPVIFNRYDLLHGAVNADSEISFFGDNWSTGGGYNHTPNKTEDQTHFSSFDAFDKYIDYFMDTTIFPKVSRVIVAGHSMGGQAVQRYAVMRKTQASDPRLYYWMANLGSWLWMWSDRPAAIAEPCAQTYDIYKYGLSGDMPLYDRKNLVAMGRDGQYARFRSRNVHIALGADDNGPGDTTCEALSQGPTHLGRGTNFVTKLNSTGGFPSTFTYDIIPTCTHDHVCMMESQLGLQRLFLDGLGGAVDTTTSSTSTVKPHDPSNTLSASNIGSSTSTLKPGDPSNTESASPQTPNSTHAPDSATTFALTGTPSLALLLLVLVASSAMVYA